jgi:hypothetical protein
VLVHDWAVHTPTMQWVAPSVLVALHAHVAGQLPVQTVAQLPLLRHDLPSGQVRQATGCPQLLVHVPQRPPQVAVDDCETQHVPLWQV